MRLPQKSLQHQTPFQADQPSDCALCTVRRDGLFAHVSLDEIAELDQPVCSGFCDADQVIYRAGEPATAAFTIRSGLVKLLLRTSNGEYHIARLLGRGISIGLEAFEGPRYTHTAVAARESNICRIPRTALAQLKQRNLALYEGLSIQWREHAQQCEIWEWRLQSERLEQRVFALIRRISDVSGDPVDAVRLLHNEDFADMLGVSLASVSRCMANLKRRGLVTRVGPWTYDCRSLLETL